MIPEELMTRLSHFENEATLALNVVEHDEAMRIHNFYALRYHELAKRILRDYGIELRPAS